MTYMVYDENNALNASHAILLIKNGALWYCFSVINKFFIERDTMAIPQIKRVLTVRYQLICMFITAAAFFVLLHRPMNNFIPISKMPRVLPITESVKAGWSNNGLAVPVVNVGLVIQDFLKFDMAKNDFIAAAAVWFEFDPQQVSLEDIDAFVFAKSDIIKKSKPFIKKRENGRTYVQWYVRIHFSTNLDYHRFPLDDHSLYVTLLSPFPAQKFMYNITPQHCKLDDHFDVTGWDIKGCRAIAGYSAEQIGDSEPVEYPKIVFAIDLEKNDGRHLFIILLPLLFIFYICMFALSIHDFALAISVIVASVSALIAYAFVMQSISPDVGYFMMSDYLFLIFLMVIFVIFLTLLFTSPDHGVAKETMLNVRGLCVLCIYAIVIVLWYYLTNVMWIA